MTAVSEPTSLRKWAALLGAGVFALAIAGAVAAWALRDDSTRRLTAQQVAGIEFSLHEIGRLCLDQERTLAPADHRLLTRIARSFVRLYRTYPEARFQVDDESAGMLSVLLVARVDLRACSPPAAIIVDRALPAQFRGPG